MSDIDASAMDRRSEPIAPCGPGNAPEPVRSLAPPQRMPGRTIDLTLLLMILLIGVPILVYCAMFSAR
ncbi:hypothetical protein [Sphingomonas sp. CFBP 8760]|uniref:hypothetical protein n=1 Tax=Sphingomonas sp. CFBP 8760 TaxID=2775282 RepID=UPI0017823015|nr:hypothetical protein [Sphingomonas sp. CFBP 8760]MBD8547245.1 hypothetical protein [Sphingomonas sp. CFBP 8760]